MVISLLISGLYVLMCVITKNRILCAAPTYVFTVFIIAFISFGLKQHCWTGVFSFILLYLSLGGLYISRKAMFSLSIGSIGILLIAFISFRQRGREYLQVQFRYGLRDYKISALLDTGNLLKDPLSGYPVLIVSADIAQDMTGLTLSQLKTPLDSIGLLPGSRLIPYNTVGQAGLFFLGLYISNLKVGGWQGNGIIALSPEIFGSKESYQALTGGYV
jgi:hypothetical protein